MTLTIISTWTCRLTDFDLEFNLHLYLDRYRKLDLGLNYIDFTSISAFILHYTFILFIINFDLDHDYLYGPFLDFDQNVDINIDLTLTLNLTFTLICMLTSNFNPELGLDSDLNLDSNFILTFT